MMEDECLKWKLKLGSRDAVGDIYEKYCDYLLTLAMALLNDPGAAEDVVQDVFVSLAGLTETFRLHGRLRSYLATCVVNRARDRLRTRARRPVREQKKPAHSHVDSPFERMVCSEQSMLIAQAMAELPDEQREVIALHLSGGLKLRQVARIQNVSVSTVKGRHRYGLQKLRSILNGRLDK